MPRDQRSGRERSKVRSRRWLTTFVVRGIELAEHLAIRREQVCVPAGGVGAGWRLARPAGYLGCATRAGTARTCSGLR